VKLELNKESEIFDYLIVLFLDKINLGKELKKENNNKYYNIIKIFIRL
jgi:hypothetical protein